MTPVLAAVVPVGEEFLSLNLLVNATGMKREIDKIGLIVEKFSEIVNFLCLNVYIVSTCLQYL